MARETWTDERLDDLNARVERGFSETREGFRETREEFRAVRSEIAALHRSTIHLFVGLTVTVLLGFGGMIVTLVTRA